MKKFLQIAGKFLLFFIGWALCISFDLPSENPALWRLGAEFIPLVVLLAFSLVFWLLERQKFPIAPMHHPVRNILYGSAIGFLWLGAAVGILLVCGTLSIIGCNRIVDLPIWMLSCFINVTMQELLVRGYLYQLLRYNYCVPIAAAVTTLLFTFLHGGAFEAGIIPVLNVFTTSVLLTAALEYSRCILLPIMMHAIWNGVGALILGGVSLSDDYPTLLRTAVSGPSLISGGSCKIEGSIVVLVINILLIIIFWTLNRKKHSPRRSTKLPHSSCIR